MVTVKIVMLLLLLLLLQLHNTSAQRNAEQNLHTHLRNSLTNYSTQVLPTIYPNNQIPVAFDFLLGQITTVESVGQYMRIAGFLFATWFEERIVWNASEFANISVINWNPQMLWTPEIIIYNAIGDDHMVKVQETVTLKSISPNRTEVSTFWRRDFYFTCAFEMRKFPMDHHVCEMFLFVTDKGRSNQIIFPVRPPLKNQMDPIGAFVENSEWQLTNITLSIAPRTFNIYPMIGPQSYNGLTVAIHISRVPTYYFLNVIVPLLLLTLLQVLVFFIPIESGEKLGFGITILLSFTVFLLLLDNIVPKSQSLPSVTVFITGAMILSTLSLLFSSLSLHLYYHDDSAVMPRVIHFVLIKVIARVLCVTVAATAGANSVQVVSTSGSQNSLSSTAGAEVKNLGDSQFETQSNGSRHDANVWRIAAIAIERLMVCVGTLGVTVMIVLLVIVPYV